MTCVAVWRTEWLNGSETFIRDQVGALERWKPVTFGLRQVPQALVPGDLVPFPAWTPARPFWWPAGVRAALARYRRFLLRSEAALVHAHFAAGGMLVRPVARAAGLPLVVTCHGFDVTRTRPGDPASPQRRTQLQGLFEEADRLIAVSEFIARRLVALGAPTHKVVVHHIGIRVPPAPAPAATRRGVLFVGRLVAKKGISDLLVAYRELPAALRADAPLRIVGDGPLRPAIEAEADALGVTVELLGWRTSEQVASLMREAAVFCAPSRTAPDGDAEGFGMVFLEASASGLPVVAYRHGGVPEAVADGDTGILVEEGDHAGLTSALAALLSDPSAAAAMGARGRSRVEAAFDITRTTAGLEAIYDDVVAAGRGGARGR